MSDLGKVMLTDGGTWDSAAEYEPLTMVRHNNASYCSTQNSTGQEPSETSDYWQLMAKDGTDGKDGVDGKDGKDVAVDSELSDTSENPVQNKVVKAAIDAKGAPVLIQETTPSDTSALWVW